MNGCLKGCLITALVLVVLVVGGIGLAVHQLTTPRSAAAPHLKITTQNVADAHQKVTAIQTAHQQASQTGQPVPFKETFTDAELSGLVNDGLSKDGSDPLGTVVVHAAGHGTIQVWSQVHYSGLNLPVYMEANISIEDGKQPVIEVNQADMGSISMPDSLRSQINSSLAEQVSLGGGQGYQGMQVDVGVGQVTISGQALPGAA